MLSSVISQEARMSFMDFSFLNTDTERRNLDYVLWLEMVMSALMLLSRIYW